MKSFFGNGVKNGLQQVKDKFIEAKDKIRTESMAKSQFKQGAHAQVYESDHQNSKYSLENHKNLIKD